jgi:hypothetical protein
MKMDTELEAPVATPKKKIGEAYRKKYGKAGHNGDAIGNALKNLFSKGIVEDTLYEIARKNGIDMAKYEGKNIGMKRMILGNLLRAMNAGAAKRPAVDVWIMDECVPAGSVQPQALPPRPAKAEADHDS